MEKFQPVISILGYSSRFIDSPGTTMATLILENYITEIEADFLVSLGWFGQTMSRLFEQRNINTLVRQHCKIKLQHPQLIPRQIEPSESWLRLIQRSPFLFAALAMKSKALSKSTANMPSNPVQLLGCFVFLFVYRVSVYRLDRCPDSWSSSWSKKRSPSRPDEVHRLGFRFAFSCGRQRKRAFGILFSVVAKLDDFWVFFVPSFYQVFFSDTVAGTLTATTHAHCHWAPCYLISNCLPRYRRWFLFPCDIKSLKRTSSSSTPCLVLPVFFVSHSRIRTANERIQTLDSERTFPYDLLGVTQ